MNVSGKLSDIRKSTSSENLSKPLPLWFQAKTDLFLLSAALSEPHSRPLRSQTESVTSPFSLTAAYVCLLSITSGILTWV
jgi:hypothetical protein